MERQEISWSARRTRIRSFGFIVLLVTSFGLSTESCRAQGKTTQVAPATEAYEGLWAQTKKDCLDDDGPNSRTLIDLGNLVEGKLTPIFDQYENHCRIEEKNKSGNVTTLALICYEFWEYFSENKEGSRAAIVISLEQKGRLRIDGKSYQLCKTPAALNAKR